MENITYDLRPDQVAGKSIAYVQGHGQATEEGRPGFAESMALYEKKIADGIINNNPRFPEDRKLRLDEVRIEGNKVEIALGVTDFYTFKKNLDITEEDSALLRAIGREQYDHEGAFFSRAAGVSILPISKDGNVLLGPRANRELYGWMNCAAGYLDFVDFTAFNPTEDALRELEEEYGIESSALIELRLAGIVSTTRIQNPNITYHAQTRMSDVEIRSRWFHLPRHEHQYLTSVTSVEDRDSLLQAGDLQIMAGTRLALESLTQEHFAGLR